jgi:hypothetical protein
MHSHDGTPPRHLPTRLPQIVCPPTQPPHADTYKRLLTSHRDYSALNVSVALCYSRLDYFDASQVGACVDAGVGGGGC